MPHPQPPPAQGAAPGQPPLAKYALLSDRQTAALVVEGSIDWLCLPRFDSPAVFARLLGDDDNGHWTIRPTAGTVQQRSYRGGSFILDTRWKTPTGRAVTTDLVTHDAAAENEVSAIRTVTCTHGVLQVDVTLVLRFEYGHTLPWVRHTHDPDGNVVLHAIAGPHSLTLHGPKLGAVGHSHVGRFHLHAGESLIWTLTWRPSHRDVAPELDVPATVRSVLDDWRRWRDSTALDGPYAREIGDCLAVLRALTLHSTGGMVAAPTTSLPELLGGERNWDYRYCWLRDSAFTISVLAGCGHHHLVEHWRNWLLRAIAGDPDDLQIMYGPAGERWLPERILDLPGYRGSRPVRVGNDAYTQYQADVVGEVMIALDLLRRGGVAENGFSWALQVALLELMARRREMPDRGTWEVRGEPHRFTHGRVMMWAAFDCGVRAVQEYGASGPVARWRSHRDELRAEILAHGVRDGSFVQHYDTDAMDAALLQIPQTGFVAAGSPLMLGTVARIERELLDEYGFVRRYRPDGGDGLRHGEGAFLMCSFWLVEQYAASGRIDEAAALMRRLLAVRNDLGLLSEEYDPASGELLGNFPQAFSHLALVRAANALRTAEPRPVRPPR